MNPETWRVCKKLSVYGSGPWSPNKARPGLHIRASTVSTQAASVRAWGLRQAGPDRECAARDTALHWSVVELKIPGSHLFLRCFFPAAPGAASTLAWVSCCSLWRSSFGEVTLARKNALPSDLIPLFLPFTQISGPKQTKPPVYDEKDTNPGSFSYSGCCWCVFSDSSPLRWAPCLSLSLSLAGGAISMDMENMHKGALLLF